MKKQINPTIKAHLIRGAFYLLLLLAVCAIPFAMGQRNTKKNVIRPGVMPPSTGAATGTLGVPAKPHSPNTSTLGRSQPHSFLGSLSRLFGRPGAPNFSPWTIVADYPVANESPAVASDGTFAYSAGGINDTSGFHLYDPVANTWTALPNVPTGIFATRAVYAANTNSVYVFGGIDASFVVQNLTQIYNVGTGTWSNGTPMPDATGRRRREHCRPKHLPSWRLERGGWKHRALPLRYCSQHVDRYGAGACSYLRPCRGRRWHKHLFDRRRQPRPWGPPQQGSE